MLNFGNKEFRNLQEQVLKNAQDIETLKGREDLQIVIVNELPEVGNPNYIYLVAKDDGESPDVYDEYIWLEDEERYEKIGGVTIDLTNYVTTDTEQSITGKKIFESTVNYAYPIKVKTTAAGEGIEFQNQYTTGHLRFAGFIFQIDAPLATNGLNPYTTNKDIGESNNPWRDLYLNGSAIIKGTATREYRIKSAGYYLDFDFYENDGLQGRALEVVYATSVNAKTINPFSNNTYNLGSSSYCWKDLYLTGNISDGVNSITVANIASKATSTFISGTFDSNGESTIDTEQAGTPEGLFIFTYGNCQCFLRLTATMVQNADTTPIRVACPMIYNSDTVNGWLNITKSGYILILKITDGTNHVDSGYVWTLTKTNLI